MNPDTSAPSFQPVGERERIASLDLLRGIALLGIFFVNMQYFTMPFMEAIDFSRLKDLPESETWAWSFVKVFFEFKFISMFSLLFGAGMAMMLQRAEAAGRPFVPVYVRRLLLLSVFGLIHGLLLWYGDILFLYSMCGFVLLLLCRLKPKVLLGIAAGCAVASLVISSGCGALNVVGMQQKAVAEELAQQQAEEQAEEHADEQAGEQAGDDMSPATPRGWDAIMAASFDPSRDEWIEGETLAYTEGPFLDALAFRSITFGFAVVAGLFGYGWRVIAMFLTGAALMKLDFFRGRSPWPARLAVAGFVIGLPLEILAVGVVWWAGFEHGWTDLVNLALHDVGSVALCLGYVGSITWLMAGRDVPLLLRPVANAGRMALTVYLSMTITSTMLMYWWGMGRFGISQAEGLGLVLIIYGALTIAATAWLSVCRMGPVEWLWRSLTYLRPQRLLR